jgi:hypothetical protein
MLLFVPLGRKPQFVRALVRWELPSSIASHMSLVLTQEVDAAHVDRDTGACVLSIYDDLDWSNRRAHLEALLHKLSYYLEYIDTGRVVIFHPLAIGRPFIIEVVAGHPLPDFGEGFIRDLEEICGLYRVGFRYRPGDPAGTPPVA